jgi:hypothetical protein
MNSASSMMGGRATKQGYLKKNQSMNKKVE